MCSKYLINKLLIIIAAAVLLLSGTARINAQPKSMGLVQSLNGISISYEHYLDTDCFIQADTGLILTDVFFGRSNVPGGYAGFSWNFIFFSKELKYGPILRIHAGPGIVAGYSVDNKRVWGPIFGLSGNIALECQYERGVTLSIGASPVIGSHFLIMKDSVNMGMYKRGLTYGFIPELGIKFNF